MLPTGLASARRLTVMPSKLSGLSRDDCHSERSEESVFPSDRHGFLGLGPRNDNVPSGGWTMAGQLAR